MTDAITTTFERCNAYALRNSALSRSTISPCCLMSPQIGVQHGNIGGSHEVVPMTFDIEKTDLKKTSDCAADAVAFGKPHGNWGTYSNSCQPRSEGATGSRQFTNEKTHYPYFSGNSRADNPCPVSPAPVSLAEFIGLAVFFFLASFAAVGGFAS